MQVSLLAGIDLLTGKGPEDIDFVVCREGTEGPYVGEGGLLRKGTPFWLVLGQSNNAGWEASVDGTNIGGSTPMYSPSAVMTSTSSFSLSHLADSPTKSLSSSICS